MKNILTGRFTEVKPAYYEILPEFMSTKYTNVYGEELVGYERQMWDKGYIKAYTTYYDNITIYRGEYFKVLYDDGYNHLYIVKENGQAGWINMPDYDERHRLNLNFFYLAG